MRCMGSQIKRVDDRTSNEKLFNIKLLIKKEERFQITPVKLILCGQNKTKWFY